MAATAQEGTPSVPGSAVSSTCHSWSVVKQLLTPLSGTHAALVMSVM